MTAKTRQSVYGVYGLKDCAFDTFSLGIGSKVKVKGTGDIEGYVTAMHWDGYGWSYTLAYWAGGEYHNVTLVGWELEGQE